ncbi:MAG: hypothetical protein AAF609_18495 [Cyanobacteria bacterium P01_C01_bin.120]
MATANITAHSIGLGDIVNGAVDEAFREELKIAIQSIRDVNKVAKSKRKISVNFELAPNADRDLVNVKVTVKSNVGGDHNEPLETTFLINGSGSTVSAVERTAEQGSFNFVQQ